MPEITQTIQDKLAGLIAGGMTDIQAVTNVFDLADTGRVIDNNGWFEVKANPISKVGVFDYLGKSIPGAADPGRIYKVYRPAEELGSPETMASLRLLPWIDDHTMLGEVPNGIPAEDKTVHGVIGEQVNFDGSTLFANIKMFSKALADLIASGKKALSLGYRCKYQYAPGTYNGTSYDYVQRQIRANHLASVDEGRMGPEVAVLDSFTFTFDQKDIQTMPDTTNPAAATGGAEEMTLEQALAAFSKLLPFFQQLMAAQAGTVVDPAAAAAAATTPAAASGAGDADGESEEDKAKRLAAESTAAGAADAEADKDKTAAAAMDAAIKRAVAPLQAQIAALNPVTLAAGIAKRDKLAADLSQHVGAFDHSAMSEQQIAAYGIKQLKLQAAAGSEGAVLSGYLQSVAAPNRRPTVELQGSAMDGADGKVPGFLTTYVAGK